MKLLEKILENNNLKRELNHIFLDGENMVATDTRILIAKKHGMNIDRECLIVNPKAKDKRIKIDTLINGMGCSTDYGKYPEYKRTMTKEPLTVLDEPMNGLELLQTICVEKGMMINFVDYAAFMKMLSKITFNRYFVGGKNLPITIANDEYTIVLMPMVMQPL